MTCSNLPYSRRNFLAALPASAAGLFLAQCASSAPATPATTVAAASSSTAAAASAGPPPYSIYRGRLPWDTVFKGENKFHWLCQQAQKNNWAALPIGQRTVAVASALRGTPYGNYTLEIDDHIEAASVNLNTLDCWTFYEASLAFARLIKSHPAPWYPAEYLKMIELERYRGGKCDGGYLSRMHHLEEVFYDNERRGLGRNVTRQLGGVRIRRNIREMQIAWKDYRYLRNSTSNRDGIARVEARVSDLPIYYIPKSKVAGIESSLQNGDVLAVVARDETGYTSHVGLASRSGATARFMHATSMRDKGRCCITDGRISAYLADKRSSIGLIVFRPGDIRPIA